jgi:Fe-S cluster assembly protein SufD
LQAPGAFSEMLALTVAHDSQEFDQRTLQIHQAPNTKSDLLYKNALRDQAKTIFSGLIVVDPDAQKTDAYQSNRNLMLSDDCEANSLPGLEIQANDVRCTHGATAGRVDEEMIFLCQARGIPRETAVRLIVEGFFANVYDRITVEPVRETLRQAVAAKLGHS